MKQIELTEKLNKIKKERLNPIKDLSIFLKLYFKNIKIFKGELFLKPALTICSILLLVSSFGVYSYNSTSVVYGSNLYKIKIGIENKILANKKTSEEKINYYAKLIDRRVSELKYLENKNFNIKELSFNIINIVYADNVNEEKYSSSIANTMLEIISLNQKIDKEFKSIKDENIKQRVSKIIEEKKLQQEKIFLEIENKGKSLKKENQNISNEIERVLLKQKKNNLIKQQENILKNNNEIKDSVNKEEDKNKNIEEIKNNNKEKQDKKDNLNKENKDSNINAREKNLK